MPPAYSSGLPSGVSPRRAPRRGPRRPRRVPPGPHLRRAGAAVGLERPHRRRPGERPAARSSDRARAGLPGRQSLIGSERRAGRLLGLRGEGSAGSARRGGGPSVPPPVRLLPDHAGAPGAARPLLARAGAGTGLHSRDGAGRHGRVREPAVHRGERLSRPRDHRAIRLEPAVRPDARRGSRRNDRRRRRRAGVAGRAAPAQAERGSLLGGFDHLPRRLGRRHGHPGRECAGGHHRPEGAGSGSEPPSSSCLARSARRPPWRS